MRILFFYVPLLLLLNSCGGTDSTRRPSEGKQSIVSDSPAGGTHTHAPSTFDMETAETLVAMHFSDLNREATYARFKGLLISIDTPLSASSTGMVSFRARVDGRQWKTPNGDTTTLPFRDTLEFLAAWNGIRWTAQASNQ